MATGNGQLTPSDTRIEFYIDVPKQLSNAAIDQMVNMLASRTRFLLGQQYRRQIRQRVTARARKAVGAC